MFVAYLQEKCHACSQLEPPPHFSCFPRHRPKETVSNCFQLVSRKLVLTFFHVAFSKYLEESDLLVEFQIVRLQVTNLPGEHTEL